MRTERVDGKCAYSTRALFRETLFMFFLRHQSFNKFNPDGAQERKLARAVFGMSGQGGDAEADETGLACSRALVNAFKDLVKKVKGEFPRRSFTFLRDGLHYAQCVRDTCGEYGWRYVVAAKEGCAPEQFAAFMEAVSRCRRNAANVERPDGELPDIRWASGSDAAYG